MFINQASGVLYDWLSNNKKVEEILINSVKSKKTINRKYVLIR